MISLAGSEAKAHRADANKPDDVAKEIAKCDAALKRSD